MTTPKLKKLLKAASEIINLYLESTPTDACDYRISPFISDDDKEKGTEMVAIEFSNAWEFDYLFLEPLADKLGPTDIKWAINRDDEKFNINLYF
jgi:hypothetical protein